MVPVIGRLAADLAVPVSVDTSKPEVMRAAVAAGAQMINDVRALTAPGALEAAAEAGAAVCLMHMQGEPATMQDDPSYGDVVAEVRDFLRARAAACVAAGIARERICIDPGIGFGKRVEHNLALLARLDELAGSIAFAALAVARGAAIVRAHDVAATLDAVKAAAALRRATPGGA